MAESPHPRRKEVLLVSVIGLESVALGTADVSSLSVYFLISQGTECYQTAVRNASQDVIWNESFQFQVPSQSTPLRIALLKDGSNPVDSVLAEASISLQKLRSMKRISEWFNMYSSDKEKATGLSVQLLKAKVNLSLSLVLREAPQPSLDLPGQIECLIISCVNLDASGSRHPNACCHVQLDRQIFQTKQAPISDHITWNHQSTIKVVHGDSKLIFDVRAGPLSLGSCEIPVSRVIRRLLISQKVDIHASVPGSRSKITGSLHLQLKYSYIPQEARSFLQNESRQMPPTGEEVKHFIVEKPRARSLIIEVVGWRLLVTELVEGLQSGKQKQETAASLYCIMRIQDREFRTTTITRAPNVEWPDGEGMLLNWNGTSVLTVEVWTGISPEFKKIATAQLLPQQISSRFDSSDLEWTPTIDIHLRRINGYLKLKISDRESAQDTKPKTDNKTDDGRIAKSVMFSKASSQAIPASVAGSAIAIKLIQAKSLIPKNMHGPHCYYCIAALGNKSVKTTTCEGTSSPMWDEELIIPIDHSGDLRFLNLTISIMDELQMGQDDTLGEITIPFNQIQKTHGYNQWHYLSDQPSDEKSSIPRVHFVLEYIQKYSGISKHTAEAIQGSDARVGLLKFEVISARNICDASEGLPASFCRIKHGKYTFDTHVAKKTRNPSWNEKHSFPIKAPKGLLTIELLMQTSPRDESVIGNHTIRLSHLVKQQKVRDWFPLTGKKATGSSPASTLSRGDVLIEFRFFVDKTSDLPRDPLDHGLHWPSTLRQAVKSKVRNHHEDELPVLHELEQTLSADKADNSLRLEFKNLRDSGAERIAMHLIRKPLIRELYLCGNKITDAGLGSLVAALRGNNRIHRLDISFNSISDEGVRILSSLFVENKYIRVVDLAANNIGGRGLAWLKQAAEHAKRPCFIHLKGNGGLPESQIQELKDVLHANQKDYDMTKENADEIEKDLRSKYQENKKRFDSKEKTATTTNDVPRSKNATMHGVSEFREFLEILGINPEIQRRFLDPRVKEAARYPKPMGDKMDVMKLDEDPENADDGHVSMGNDHRSPEQSKAVSFLKPSRMEDTDRVQEESSGETGGDSEEDDEELQLGARHNIGPQSRKTEIISRAKIDDNFDDEPPRHNDGDAVTRKMYALSTSEGDED